VDVSSDPNVKKPRKSRRGTIIIYWLLPDAYIDQYDWTARSDGRGYSQIPAQATFLSACPVSLDKSQRSPKGAKSNRTKTRHPLRPPPQLDRWPSGYGASFRFIKLSASGAIRVGSNPTLFIISFEFLRGASTMPKSRRRGTDGDELETIRIVPSLLLNQTINA
jgi:hypothetical protein